MRQALASRLQTPKRRPVRAAGQAGVAAMAPWGWAVAGAITGLLAALVIWAPAAWAASALDRATDGRLQLADARGTVWDGSARLVITGGIGSADAAALPSRLEWQLRPALDGARLSLSASCCTTAPLALSLSAWANSAVLTVADGPASQWPASLLAGLGTPWNTLALDGTVQLQTRGLRLHWNAERLQVEGGAEVTLLDVSSRIATLRPLGSYRLRLAGGPTPGLELGTLSGALTLEGRGQWIGGRLRFNGEARATPGREAALDNLLNIIGRRDGSRALITMG